MSSSYIIDSPQIGQIKVTKKRGQKTLRIRLNSKGEVLVSAPYMVPRAMITRFIDEKANWIEENRPEYKLEFYDGMKFGEKLTLRLHENQSKNRAKFIGNYLNIYLSGQFTGSDKQIKYIEFKILQAMKNEAEEILLPRLYEISKVTGHEFNQAFIKTLKSRWGSCDSYKNIILNVYMLNLPSNLRDYVIVHELTHTVHMNHSSEFWGHIARFIPDYKVRRKELKDYHTRIEDKNIA